MEILDNTQENKLRGTSGDIIVTTHKCSGKSKYHLVVRNPAVDFFRGGCLTTVSLKSNVGHDYPLLNPMSYATWDLLIRSFKVMFPEESYALSVVKSENINIELTKGSEV